MSSDTLRAERESGAIDIPSRAKNFRPANGSEGRGQGVEEIRIQCRSQSLSSNFNYILSSNFKIINNAIPPFETGNFKSFGINNSFVSFVLHFPLQCKQFVSIRYQFRVKRISFFFLYKFRSIDTLASRLYNICVRLLSEIKKKRKRETCVCVCVYKFS